MYLGCISSRRTSHSYEFSIPSKAFTTTSILFLRSLIEERDVTKVRVFFFSGVISTCIINGIKIFIHRQIHLLSMVLYVKIIKKLKERGKREKKFYIYIQE